MAAPSYSFTNYFGTSDPAGDILTLIETQLTNTEWVFVEQVSFTQSAVARVMRVWKCPSTLNAAGVDFYIGLVKNTAAGVYFATRCFEGWNTTTKTMQRPVLTGGASLAGNWSSIAYGNGTYVAVANGTVSLASTAATSTDGINWTTRLMPTTATTWTGVTYGGGLFVAVASGTSIAATSPDGITWTTRALPSSQPWSAVTYGGTTFVAISTGTSVAANSPDGITWTARALPSSGTWSAVTYGGGTFVAIGNGVAATSPDGAAWTARTVAASPFGSIAYGSNTFVAVTTGSTTTVSTYSTNAGVTWTAATLPVSQTYGAVAFGNGTFVATAGVGASNAGTSPDGINWTPRTQTIGSTSAVVYGATFCAVGTQSAANGAQTSPDGATWTVGKGLGLASSIALGDYLTTGATVPLQQEGVFSFAVTTNYDIAILASKSYLAIGINLNGTGTTNQCRVIGLYSPAYSDAVTTNPPLMSLSLNAIGTNVASGVSRSMRVPIDGNGASTFGVGAGPESLLLGSFSGGTKEPVSQSIRGSRVALVAGTGNTTGFTTTGGMRGWLYDCTAVATTTATVMKVADTVTIGATVWTGFTTSTATANTGITNQPVGYFFNILAGS